MTLDSMAAAFDVSPAFLDAELAGFICAGRISAKIDKVAGVIETMRCVVHSCARPQLPQHYFACAQYCHRC